MAPNPGSDEAIAQGCTCPVLDNAHGQGFPWGDVEQAFWQDPECPVHKLPPVPVPFAEHSQ